MALKNKNIIPGILVILLILGVFVLYVAINLERTSTSGPSSDNGPDSSTTTSTTISSAGIHGTISSNEIQSCVPQPMNTLSLAGVLTLTTK